MIVRFFILALLVSCLKSNPPNSMLEEENDQANVAFLEVLEVSISGVENNYTFSVKLKSEDEGCEQYADWWEVISKDKRLIYRRNLAHSHVNEQPFTRSGGPVTISANTVVFIRGHMNNMGYGELIMSGSVADGFKKDTLDSEFAKELQEMEPLPPDCAF